MTEHLIPFIALTAMEIVLGIDNIVFIAILAARLPPEQRGKARTLGLALALVMRIALLAGLKWLMDPSQSEPLFRWSELHIPDRWLPVEANEVTMRDIVMILGGLFLLWKSVREIHHKLEGHDLQRQVGQPAGMAGTLGQIAVMDIVFSIDSVITAVGVADDIWVMIAAVIVAVIVMLAFAGRVSAFVDRHPTIKMLALSFLILIGVMLLADGFGTHVNKGYIYFAMAFALAVETLNLRVRSKQLAA